MIAAQPDGLRSHARPDGAYVSDEDMRTFDDMSYEDMPPFAESGASRPVRVAVVDDYDIVRLGLAKLLQRQPDIRLVATARNGREALELVEKHALDVLILDIAMPDCGAVDIVQQLTQTHPEVKVLIFTGYPEKRYAAPLARLGAHGYLDKTAPVGEVVNAVKILASGRTYFSRSAESILNKTSGAATGENEDPGLTVREFQIFLRLAKGETVTDIANALGVSDVTISSHRARLLQKLKLNTNSHLTRYAIEKGFLL